MRLQPFRRMCGWIGVVKIVLFTKMANGGVDFLVVWRKGCIFAGMMKWCAQRECRWRWLGCLLLLAVAGLPSVAGSVATGGAPSVPTDDGKTIVYLDLRPLLLTDYADSLALLDTWDQLHAVSTLQGIVNRKVPRLYIEYVECDGRSIDAYWWQKYREPDEWLAGRDTLTLHSVEEAVAYFRNRIKGAVVYDASVPSTSAVASAVAGVEDLIALRYDDRPSSLYSRLVGACDVPLPVGCRLVGEDGSPLFTAQGLIPGTERPSSHSLKCDPYLWFIERYMKTNRLDGRYGAYYIDQAWREVAQRGPMNHHTLTNHDFFVARKGFFFDLSPWEDEATDDAMQPIGTDHATLCELLDEAYRLRQGRAPGYIGGFPAWAYKYTTHVGGHHQDVETEWHFAELISRYMTFKDADAIGYGAMANASFWQHFPLQKRYPQKWTSRRELRRKGLLDAQGRVDASKNYVVIYVGDYDATSWITQRTPTLWDNADRGRMPLMWCVSPVLAERAPMVLHYFRQTASPLDYFAAADNGAGYLMPGVAEHEGRDGDIGIWERHCRRWYRQWGLTVTGFVIDGNGPAMGEEALDAYARFSPNGIVPQKCEPLSLYNGMPVLRSDWDLVSENPSEAASVLLDRVHDRSLPFHWFRTILKSPTWHCRLKEEVERRDSSIVFLSAPEFFELLKIYAGRYAE